MSDKAYTVLLADDDEDFRDSIVDLLEGHGWSVTAVKDGREALTSLAKLPLPKLVLLDLKMPRVDGFGVLTEMGNSSVLSTVPVIVMSASVETSDALRRGARKVLTKPIDVDTLVAEVAKFLGG